MATLVLERVPQEVYDQLVQAAEARKAPVESEAVRMLRQALRHSEEARASHAAILAELRRERQAMPPSTLDSADLLREDRDR